MHPNVDVSKSSSSAPAAARLSAEATSGAVVDCIRTHGYAIVEGLAPKSTRQAALELEPYFARSPMGAGSFTGERTQRVARLVARSGACRKLIMHPLVLATVSGLFEGHCYHPQITLSQALRIHPGQPAQELHRDDNVFPFRHPRPATVLFTHWALSEFTIENGATRIIPGSHSWDDEQRADRAPTLSATMPPGSLLLWEGATYHGGGHNISGAARSSVLIGYSVAWLRQYENQYLAVPPELARTLEPDLQDLLGYRNHGYLGTYENQDARALLRDPHLQLPAPLDLFTEDLAALPRKRH